jgi:hypothetical protein
MIIDLKKQWESLWEDRLVDKKIAEATASRNYPDLFIDKGTVLHATRNYKVPCLEEIISKHKLSLDLLPPTPQIGGYGVFIRKYISDGTRQSKNSQLKDKSSDISKLQKKKEWKWMALHRERLI